jgi:hypothetical protein
MRIVMAAAASVAAIAVPGTAWAACGVAKTSSADVGTFSPAALYSTDTVPSAMPYVATTGSFGCANTTLLALMSNDSLVATVKAGTVLTLKSGTSTATYLLAADQGGQYPLVPGTPRTLVNGTGLALLSNGRAAVPIYLKARSTTSLAPGVYTGSFEVKWDWSFCTLLGLDALGLVNICLNRDSGSASGTVAVTMTVAEKGAIVSVSQRTTWEASASTNNPKAIPGSKLRIMMRIENPDIVPLDLNTLAVTLPTPAGLRIALDGDGTGNGRIAVQLCVAVGRRRRRRFRHRQQRLGLHPGRRRCDDARAGHRGKVQSEGQDGRRHRLHDLDSLFGQMIRPARR